MHNLRDFLEKYKLIAPSDGAIRKTLAEIVLERARVRIPERDIKIIGSVAYIESDPMIKSAIFLNQSAILEDFFQKTGKRTITALH